MYRVLRRAVLFTTVVCGMQLSKALEEVADKVRSHPQIDYSDPELHSLHVTASPANPTEGMNLTLHCWAFYDVGFNLFPQWSVPNPTIPSSGRLKRDKSISVDKDSNRKGVNTLEITRLTKDDEGIYTCRSIDLLGNQYELPYQLRLVDSV